MSVILVSSDVDLQAILMDRLVPHGYTVLATDDAETAEQLARLPGVRSVLLDLDASPVHATTFLRCLQQYCPKVRVIALSIRAQLGRAALQAGASRYVVKPLDLPTVIIELSQCGG
ncbi:MAG TPA: response regulator [Nitrospiraceae bacterium]|nr:response regulator [Nitrospiraceae bacterium]